jgi:iron complex outermembrane receptor protein
MDSDLALERTLAGSGLTSRRDTSGALAIIRQSDSRSQAEIGLVTTQIEDVIVTARRTEERSQDVPVAVSAFSQESLREKGIQTATDLQNFTPSLTVLGHVSRNQEEFTLRGMGGSGGFGTGSGPGVVAYFAETPNSASGPGASEPFRPA